MKLRLLLAIFLMNYSSFAADDVFRLLMVNLVEPNYIVASFDGNDKIEISDDSTLDFGTGDFSLAAWIKSDEVANFRTPFGKDSYPGGSNYTGFLIQKISDGKLVFMTRDVVGNSGPVATAYSTTILQANQWYHLVVKRQSNEIYIYVNGVLEDTTVETTPIDINNSASFHLGKATPWNNQFWKGDISDVHLWARALTAIEITDLFNDDTEPSSVNLVGHWLLEGDALDETTNDNDGTVTGATFIEDPTKP